METTVDEEDVIVSSIIEHKGIKRKKERKLSLNLWISGIKLDAKISFICDNFCDIELPGRPRAVNFLAEWCFERLKNVKTPLNEQTLDQLRGLLTTHIVSYYSSKVPLRILTELYKVVGSEEDLEVVGLEDCDWKHKYVIQANILTLKSSRNDFEKTKEVILKAQFLLNIDKLEVEGLKYFGSEAARKIATVSRVQNNDFWLLLSHLKKVKASLKQLEEATYRRKSFIAALLCLFKNKMVRIDEDRDRNVLKLTLASKLFVVELHIDFEEIQNASLKFYCRGLPPHSVPVLFPDSLTLERSPGGAAKHIAHLVERHQTSLNCRVELTRLS